MLTKGGILPQNDLTGKKFYSWTVLKFIGRWEKNYITNGKLKKSSVPCYECECDCGKRVTKKHSDILASKGCMDCREKNWEKPRAHSPFHKQKIKGNGNPNWKGTENIPYVRFTQALRNSKIREIEFSLNIENLQEQWNNQSGKCPYTGLQLCFKTGRDKRRKFEFSNDASLDRIDSNKGYEIGNIQWVCKTINMMKNQLSDDEFFKFIKMIYEFRKLS